VDGCTARRNAIDFYAVKANTEGRALMATRNSFEVEKAKEFLKTRIIAEALQENVPLLSAEVGMLTYSEPKATRNSVSLRIK
jgi:hypothetical protein